MGALCVVCAVASERSGRRFAHVGRAALQSEGSAADEEKEKEESVAMPAREDTLDKCSRQSSQMAGNEAATSLTRG